MNAATMYGRPETEEEAESETGRHTEFKELPPYCPFLNIVEQSIRALKAAIKADISRPEVQQQMKNHEEPRRQGIALEHHRT